MQLRSPQYDGLLLLDIVVDAIIVKRWRKILVMGANGKDESGQCIMQGGDISVLRLLKPSVSYSS